MLSNIPTKTSGHLHCRLYITVNNQFILPKKTTLAGRFNQHKIEFVLSFINQFVFLNPRHHVTQCAVTCSIGCCAVK